jgi:hypothetical protein
MGQTIDFLVWFHLQGAPGGTPVGKLALVENGKPAESWPLQPGPGSNGEQQLYRSLIFTRAARPGPAMATFTVTIGQFQASRSVRFTLAS